MTASHQPFIVHGHYTHPDTGREEPCLHLCRRDRAGLGRRYILPLSSAHLALDGHDIMECAMRCANTLYGDGGFTKSEAVAIASAIERELDALVLAKPKPQASAERQRLDLENEAERIGLKITVDGEAVMDMSK